MLVARIRTGDAERADPGLVDQRQQRREVAVVDMGAVPVAEADMEPDLLRRDVGEGHVERPDVERDPLQEVVERPVLEHELALHGEVGSVDL